MSSHHIVRDEQEPALIIHRMHDFPYETLGSLLEWSPTLICCGPAIDQVVDLGVKIDMAIVPFESRQQMQESLAGQEPVKVISLSNPDYLSSGMQVLISENHVAVNIVTSDELIHEVIDLCSQFVGKLQVSVWSETGRYTLVNVPTLKKWFPENATVSFYTVADHANFQAFLDDDQILNADEIRVTKEGMIKVVCDKPPFVMIEPFAKG